MATERTPYTDSTISRRVVAKMVSMVDWTQAPLLKRLGLDMDKKVQFHNWPPGGQKKVEWLEDDLPGSSTTLSAAVSNTTITTIQLTNGALVHEGSILQIDSEYMIVQAAPTGNTVTVTRGQGGTTAATHTNSTAVYIRGIAKKSGANYAIGYTTTMTAPYNYVQTLEESIKVNNDQQLAQDYGVEDTAAYHLAKLIGGNTQVGERGRAGKLILDLARMAYWGKRQAGSDTVEPMAGGLDTFISTNTYGSSSVALSRTNIHTALRDIYNAGGMPDLLVTSAYGSEVIAEMYEDRIRTERSEERGGNSIRYIDTPVVEGVEVLVDHLLPDTATYIMDSARVGWATVRPFEPTEKPSLGDYRVWSVLGDYTFIVCNEETHAKITHSGAS